MMLETIKRAGSIVNTRDCAPRLQNLVIQGKTRLNLWHNPGAGTNHGVTYSITSDGKARFSGTATSGGFFVQTYIYNLKPNTSYVLSANWGDSRAFLILVNQDEDLNEYDLYGASVKQVSFTTPSAFTGARIGFYAPEGYVMPRYAYKVMLNEGTEPEPWCRPGLLSVTDPVLVTAGKNLFEPTGPGKAGLTVSNDGVVKVDGDAGVSWYKLGNLKIIEGQTYTITHYGELQFGRVGISYAYETPDNDYNKPDTSVIY